MKKPGNRMTDLSLSKRVFLVLFLPFLVVHLALIVPVVEWFCLCPADDPHWNCCCNCPKCVERRGGFKSYCHLRPTHEAEARLGRGKPIAGLQAVKKGVLKDYYVSMQTLCCDCSGYIKNISIDLKAFLLSMQMPDEVSLPVVALLNSDDRWPPEAIPCHPDVPG